MKQIDQTLYRLNRLINQAETISKEKYSIDMLLQERLILTSEIQQHYQQAIEDMEKTLGTSEFEIVLKKSDLMISFLSKLNRLIVSPKKINR
jgi:hypothetical protein